MARLTKLLCAALFGAASAVSKERLGEWLYSSKGLDLSRSDAEKVATREYKQLSYARATLDSLSALKNTLYSSSGMDFSKSEVATTIFPLAYSRVDANELLAMYKSLYGTSGADLQKAQAREAAIKLGVQHTNGKNIIALWKALYSISGLNLAKSEAQRWVVDLTSAGVDVDTLQNAYKQYSRSMPKGQAVQSAMEDAVFANLGGYPTRYAKDGKLYSSKGFKMYYGDSWLNEWIASPEERRTANDGKDYTAAEFQQYFGDSWSSKWSASPVAQQKRVAADGQIYTVEQFAAHYHSNWQAEWFQAVEVADDCAFQNHDACDALKGKCAWKWTGDWTDSCVPGASRDIVV